MSNWSYKRINNLTGGLVAFLAFCVYFSTMERTASFWDCGEFIACAYKLEVGHSPGAPLFMMLQRLSALCSGSAAWYGHPSQHAAFAINTFSVLTSALTILFLFWTITMLCKKMLANQGSLTTKQKWLIMMSGIIGALTYTFSDTFWFSAVEAEVYATSSCFTALVFWAALKWEQEADKPHADRWLLLIALLIGASVGIHLLNLLTIPAIAMIYYFKKYSPRKSGIIIALIAGCLLLAIVQFGIIQYIPIMASNMELYFVNDLNLPFQSGAITCFIILTLALFFVIRYTKKRSWHVLHTATLSLTFIIIGCSSYVVTVIRSNADTPVDINNPDQVMSLVSYLQREQYLQQPLLHGPDFDSKIIGIKDGKNSYYKNTAAHNYAIAGHKMGYEYDPAALRLFPRIWDNSNQSHVNFYRQYLDIPDGVRPSSKDNLSFFFHYQMNWLWWRYFMWNYAGRQNDYEGQGESKNGNWISGIPFIDYPRVGHLNKMSSEYRNNAARNEFYCIPLLLGILGLCFHFKKSQRDAIVILLLFIFTGIAIGIYLNMNPLQPRERDYAFAGCTYAFAIWIGMGLLTVEAFLNRWIPKGSVMTAFLLCLVAVPVLMAKEGWNDHNRSNKSLARATALNTLNSCEPNAILFTQGDNDTFPLWYLQEVEGIRTDVRVIIRELLSADWYIDQLNYKINDADAIPMVWQKKDYMGEKNNYINYYDNVQIPKDRPFDLYEICKFMFDGKNNNKLRNSEGEEVSYLPTKYFSMPLPNRYAKGASQLSDKFYFRIAGDGLMKNDIAVMNILAANANNGWKRPIYFNGSYPNRDDVLGLNSYMRMEGIVYQLAPFYQADYNAAAKEINNINIEKSLSNLNKVYQYGGAEKNNVYFDEKNRVMLIAYRLNSIQVADRLASVGRKKEAVALLDKMQQNVTPQSYPHDYLSIYMVQAYLHADAPEKARNLAEQLKTATRQDMEWIKDLPESQRASEEGDFKRDEALLQQLDFLLIETQKNQ